MKKLLYIFPFLVSFVTFSQIKVTQTKSFSVSHADSVEVYSYDYFFPLENNSHSVTKGWKFQHGDSLLWKEKDFDDSEWLPIERDTLGKVIKKEMDFKGSGWFRNSFEIDSTLVGIPLTLEVELIGAFEIYLDEKPLKTFGKFKTETSETEVFIAANPIRTALVDIIFEQASKHTIAVKYENPSITKTDNFLNFSLKISKTAPIIHNSIIIKRAMSMIVFIGAVFITLFVFHLILFLFYRKFIPNLYFSLFSFSMGGGFIVISYSVEGLANMKFINLLGISIIILTILSAFSLSGLVNTLFSKNKLRFKIFSVICLLSLFSLFNSDIASFVVLLLYMYSFTEATILLIKAIIQKVKGARILASGILLTIFFTVALIIFTIIYATKDGLEIENAVTGSILAIIILGVIFSIFSIPFSMSAYLAWYFSHINRENEQKVIEVEQLTEQNLNQEKEKQALIKNINQELEIQVENRKNEIEKQKAEIEIQNQTLETERQKSEALLLNILPEEVALELKEKGKTQSKFFDSVTILFTDFKDFTKMAEKVSSTELIEELNYCFKAFDEIISKYGIEKIKTIGDAYMAVSGLPVKDENHAIKMIYASLEIRDFMEEYKQKRINQGKEYFEMRIGINSGEVVAGIVGIKKFAYDIWGTAVNIASEMEVNGTVGKVNISENTYELIKNDFDTELRPENLEDSQIKMYFAEFKEKSVNFEKAKDFILNKQKQELPEHLHYHNLNHILDVYDAVNRYARLEGIGAEDTELLKMASLFHDSGFIVQADGHEQISCGFAEKYLPDFGYSLNQIEKIKGMIMTTKIPQSPKNHLEQILADADLDYLGRDDFEEISNGLFEELKAENKVSDINTWNKIQISFFEKHNYFTDSAKRLRNRKKQENLEKIKEQTQF